MAHFFHHDHRRVLVQRLVDGGHLAELHQLLDDLRGLDRHLVGQLAHSDGFGHVHFEHACFDRCLWCAVVITVAVSTAFGATTPIVTAHTTRGIATRFDGLLFGLIIGPAGRQLGTLDLFVASTSCSARCRSTGTSRTRRLVQGALDGFRIRCGLWFFGHQGFGG